MTNTYTLQLLSIAIILFIIVLAILIWIYWPGFISKLNKMFNDPQSKIYPNENRGLNSKLDRPTVKLLEAEKKIRFQQCGDSSLVFDFFWQDHDLLWENRLN